MSFITKRERVFNEYNLFDLPARNEGKLKAYASCTDARAWSHFCSDKTEHLVEIIKRNNERCRPKYVPTEVIVNTLMIAKNNEITRLKRKIEEFEQMLAAYDQLELTADQKIEIANAHASIKAANKELDELCLDLDLSGFTEGIDSEAFETGKSRGDEASRSTIETAKSAVSEWSYMKEPLQVKASYSQVDYGQIQSCDISTCANDPRIEEMQDLIICQGAKLNAMKNTIAVLEYDICEPYSIYANIYTALEKIFGILHQNQKYKNYLDLLTVGKSTQHIHIIGKILYKIKVLEKFSLALIAPCNQGNKPQECSCYHAEIVTNIETTYALTDTENCQSFLDSKRARLVADIIDIEEMRDLFNKESLCEIENSNIKESCSLDECNISKENINALKNLQTNFNDLMICYENLKLEKDNLFIRCQELSKRENDYECLQNKLKEYNNLWNEKEIFRKRSDDLDELKKSYYVLLEETSNLELKLKAESEISKNKSKTINELKDENVLLEKRLNESSLLFEKEKNTLIFKLKEYECDIMCKEQQIKSLSSQIEKLLEQIANISRNEVSPSIELLNEISVHKEQIANLLETCKCLKDDKIYFEQEFHNNSDLIIKTENELESWKSKYEKITQTNEILNTQIKLLCDENQIFCQKLDEKENAIENLHSIIQNKSEQIDNLIDEVERKNQEKNELLIEIHEMRNDFKNKLVLLDKENNFTVQEYENKEKNNSRSNIENVFSMNEKNYSSSSGNNHEDIISQIKLLRQESVDTITKSIDIKEKYKNSLELTKKESLNLEKKLLHLNELTVPFETLKEDYKTLMMEKNRIENNLRSKTSENTILTETVRETQNRLQELEVYRNNEILRKTIEKTLSDKEAEILSLRENIQSLQLEKESSFQKYCQLKLEYDELIIENNQNREFEIYKNNNEILRKTIEQNISDKEAEILSLRENIQSIQLEKESLCKTIEQNLSDKEAEILSLRENIQSIQLEKESLFQKYYQLKLEYDELIIENDNLKIKFDEKTLALNNTVTQLESSNKINQDLQTQLKDLKSKEKSLINDISSLKHENVSINSSLHSLSKQNIETNNLLNYYENIEVNYKNLKVEHDQIKSDKENEKLRYEETIKKLENYNKELKIQGQKNFAEKEILEKLLENTRKEVICANESTHSFYSDIKKELDNMKNEKIYTNEKILDLMNKLQSSEQLIISLKDDVLKRNNTISELQNHINNLQEEIKTLHENLEIAIENGEEISKESYERIDESVKNVEAHYSKATHNMKMELAKLQEKNDVQKNQSPKINSFSNKSDVGKHEYQTQIMHLQMERELIVDNLNQLELKILGYSILSVNSTIEDVIKVFNMIRKTFDEKNTYYEQNLLGVQNSYQLLKSKAEEAEIIVQNEKKKMLSEKENIKEERMNIEKKLQDMLQQLKVQESKYENIIRELEDKMLNQRLLFEQIQESKEEHINKLKEEILRIKEIYEKSVAETEAFQQKVQNLLHEKKTQNDKMNKLSSEYKEKSIEIQRLQNIINEIKDKSTSEIQLQTEFTIMKRDRSIQTDENEIKHILLSELHQMKSNSYKANSNALSRNSSFNSMELNEINIPTLRTANEVQILTAKVEPTFDFVKNIYQNYKIARLQKKALEQVSLSSLLQDIDLYHFNLHDLDKSISNSNESDYMCSNNESDKLNITSLPDTLSPENFLKSVTSKKNDIEEIHGTYDKKKINNNKTIKTKDLSITSDLNTQNKNKELSNSSTINVDIIKPIAQVYSPSNKESDIKSQNSLNIYMSPRSITYSIEKLPITESIDKVIDKINEEFETTKEIVPKYTPNVKESNVDLKTNSNLLNLTNRLSSSGISDTIRTKTVSNGYKERIYQLKAEQEKEDRADFKMILTGKNNFNSSHRQNLLRSQSDERIRSINSSSSENISSTELKSKKCFNKSVLVKLDKEIECYENKIKDLSKTLDTTEKENMKKFEAMKNQYENHIKNIINEHNQGVMTIQTLHEETLSDIIKIHDTEIENLRAMSIDAMRKAENLEKDNEKLKSKLERHELMGLDQKPVKLTTPELKNRKYKSHTSTCLLTKTDVQALNVKPNRRSSGLCTCSLDINISDTVRSIFEQVDVGQRKLAEQTYLRYIANKLLENIESLNAKELSFLHLKVCQMWKIKLTKEETLKLKIDSLESDLMKKQRQTQKHISELDRKVTEERQRLQEVRKAICRNSPVESRDSSPHIPIMSTGRDKCNYCTTRNDGVETCSAGEPTISAAAARSRRRKLESHKIILVESDFEEQKARNFFKDETPPIRLRRPKDRSNRPAKKLNLNL